MFFGHIGLGLAANRIDPATPAAVQVSLAMTQDILAFPCILLADASFDSVSITHGLFMSFVWAGAASLTMWLVKRNARSAVVAGALVLSHWILDFIAWPMGFGRGLPLFFKGSPEVGLGLYNSTIGSILGEAAGLALMAAMIVRLRRDRAAKRATPTAG